MSRTCRKSVHHLVQPFLEAFHQNVLVLFSPVKVESFAHEDCWPLARGGTPLWSPSVLVWQMVAAMFFRVRLCTMFNMLRFRCQSRVLLSSSFVENDVETVREADEAHSGHRTQAIEEAGSIVLHVGHDMNGRKTTAISNEEACHEGEATMEHVIETDCPGEELPEHCTRTDEEAGSIVLHVGHDMNEKQKNDRLGGAVCYEDEIMMEFKQEETSEAVAATKTPESNEEISKEDVGIRRLIEERRTTPKEEKQRLKEVNKHIRNCIRDKKIAKRHEEIQRILEDF